MVRNARAKIGRVKTNYEIDLSNDIQIPELGSFETRDAFNDFKRNMKSFTNRSNQNYQYVKNDYGVVATKREIHIVEANTTKAQRIADNIKKQIEKENKRKYYSGGKEQSTVGQMMAQMARPEIGVSRPPDFDFETMRTRHAFKQKMESMEKRADPMIFEKRKAHLKENIIKKMEKSFNSEGDELVKRLQGLHHDVLYQLFLQHEEFQFGYRYTHSHLGEDDVSEELSDLHSILDTYEQGEENTDLWAF